MNSTLWPTTSVVTSHSTFQHGIGIRIVSSGIECVQLPVLSQTPSSSDITIVLSHEKAFACKAVTMSFRARFSNILPSNPYGKAPGTATNCGYEKMIIIVGNEDSPSGLRKVETSRPHIAHLSHRWAEAFIHKIVRHYVGLVHVIFPDDDANAMCLLLAIAHTDTANLPVRLSLDEIIRLAQVAERYDLNHLLVGYLEPWLAPHRQRITERGYEHWLYVAWQLGLEKDYLFLADYLAVNCAINEQKKLLIPSTDRLFIGHFPRNALRKFDAIDMRTSLIFHAQGPYT
jgi:hypothetical protein